MGTTTETVSVIIPCFNSEKTLAACLDAVVTQTRPLLEIIVVDDVSTDTSRQIAAGYPCRLITQPANRGPAAARNTGAAASSGSVLFFVDSDAALEPDAVDAALKVIETDPDCALVQGIYHSQPLFADGPVEEYKTLFEHFWRRRCAGPVTVTLFAVAAIRRSAFEEVGGFDESLRDGEDVEFGTRLPARWRVLMSSAVTARHDDVDRLRPLLREQYRRATVFGPNVVRALRRRGGRNVSAVRTNALSPAGVLFSAATLATLPLPLAAALPGTGWDRSPLLTAVLLGTPILAYSGFLVANRALLGFVRRRRGAAFTGYFAAIHFLTTAVTALGTAAGILSLARTRPGTGPAARPEPRTATPGTSQ